MIPRDNANAMNWILLFNPHQMTSSVSHVFHSIPEPVQQAVPTTVVTTSPTTRQCKLVLMMHWKYHIFFRRDAIRNEYWMEDQYCTTLIPQNIETRKWALTTLTARDVL